MFFEILVQGCLITTQRRYVKFGYASETSIIDSLKDDCLFIRFRRGFRASDIIDTRIKVIKDQELVCTDYISTVNPVYNLNGLKIAKIVPHDYVFGQYLVKNLDCLKMLYDENQCQILIPFKSDYRLDKYIELINTNPYIKVIGGTPISIKNFYSINLSNKPITINSGNEFIFNTKKFYTRYILEPIDIQSSFITQLSNILKDYGLDLIRFPIDENVQTVDHVVYRFTDTGKQLTHKTGFTPLDNAVQHTSRIDFELTTPNIAILDDFKTRYQNINLVSNFTVFHTKDRLNRDWSSEARWGTITTDFNQDYDQDNQGNNAHKASFSVDLTYYVVYDLEYYRIQQTILDLISNESIFEQIIIE